MYTYSAPRIVHETYFRWFESSVLIIISLGSILPIIYSLLFYIFFGCFGCCLIVTMFCVFVGLRIFLCCFSCWVFTEINEILIVSLFHFASHWIVRFWEPNMNKWNKKEKNNLKKLKVGSETLESNFVWKFKVLSLFVLHTWR